MRLGLKGWDGRLAQEIDKGLPPDPLPMACRLTLSLWAALRSRLMQTQTPGSDLVDSQGVALGGGVLLGDGVGLHEGHQDHTEAVLQHRAHVVHTRGPRPRQPTLETGGR